MGIIRTQKMLRQFQVTNMGPGTDEAGGGGGGGFFGGGFSNTKCLELNGTDEYLTANGVCADIAGNVYSVSGWIKTTTTAKSYFLSFNDSSYGNRVQVGLDSGYVYLYVSSDVTTTTLVADNTWKHIVLTVDHGATQAKVYVNGLSVINHGTSLDMRASDLFTIGAEWDAGPAASDFYAGKIDEVSCWNTTLTQAEVTELYNGGSSMDLSSHSKAANLKGWWRMGDDGSSNPASSIVDQTANSNNATPVNMAASNVITDGP